MACLGAALRLELCNVLRREFLWKQSGEAFREKEQKQVKTRTLSECQSACSTPPLWRPPPLAPLSRFVDPLGVFRSTLATCPDTGCKKTTL